MWTELTEIIDEFELTRPEAEVLKKTVKTCCDQEDIGSILKKIKLENGDCNDLREYQAFYDFCMACIYLEVNNYKAAFGEARNALERFRFCGDQFNEGLTHRFIGMIYQKEGEEIAAIAEYDKAEKIFAACAKAHANESNYPKKTVCEVQLGKCKTESDECEKQILAKKQSPPPAAAAAPAPRKPAPRPNWPPTARLVYSIQNTGHANGAPDFASAFEDIGELSIDSLSSVGDRFAVYNPRPGTGNEIRLNPAGAYHWFKVAGTSMNQATPVPIEPDDFILADLNTKPSLGNIIIATLRNSPTNEEWALVVKRYTGHGLVSESTESVTPIPLADVKIQGIVLAVAKKETGTPVPQTASTG